MEPALREFEETVYLQECEKTDFIRQLLCIVSYIIKVDYRTYWLGVSSTAGFQEENPTQHKDKVCDSVSRVNALECQDQRVINNEVNSRIDVSHDKCKKVMKIKPCYRQKIAFSHYESYKVYCACAE